MSLTAFLFDESNHPVASAIKKIKYPISAAMRGGLLFNRIKERGMVLNIGCGRNSNPNHINLDYYWQPGIDVVWDITKSLPFADNYVSGIFTEHCLEHIPFDGTLVALQECYRVMQRGSRIRIVLPDLGLYIERYNTGKEMPYASFIDHNRPDGIYSPAMSINRVFYEYGHRFIYDFPMLEAMMQPIGFINIEKVAYLQGYDATIKLDTAIREGESLYVEAVKPL